MIRFIRNGFAIAAVALAGNTLAGDKVADPSKHEHVSAPARPAQTGSGGASSKFTKVANNGADLPAGATLGAAVTDWACTRDGDTGLTWEVKTANGLRSKDHTYTWYSSDSAPGAAGVIGTDTCDGTLSAYSNQCNTANFVAAVNSAKLCGYADWRLPTLRELQSLVDFSIPADGLAPTIDAAYFPNTQIKWTWSSTSFAANPSGAWGVRFHGGFPYADAKTWADAVRLVRGDQWFDLVGALRK